MMPAFVLGARLGNGLGTGKRGILKKKGGSLLRIGDLKLISGEHRGIRVLKVKIRWTSSGCHRTG